MSCAVPRPRRHRRRSNKSLEGTPAEQSCFALSDVCRRPSAHRSRSGRTMMLQGESAGSKHRRLAVPFRLGSRHDGCVDRTSPCMCIPDAINSWLKDSALGVLFSFGTRSWKQSRNVVSYRLHSRSKTHSSNKSLERMPAEHGCFVLSVVGGHRSAHRSGITGAMRANSSDFMSSFQSSGSDASSREVPREVAIYRDRRVQEFRLSGFPALASHDLPAQFCTVVFHCLPNQSLERTTAESAIFHSQMLGGRRSALR